MMTTQTSHSNWTHAQYAALAVEAVAQRGSLVVVDLPGSVLLSIVLSILVLSVLIA